MKLKSKLLICMHIASILFLVVNVFQYTKQVEGVAGTITTQEEGNTFLLTPTLASGGSLTVDQKYYFRVVAYNASAAILMSPIATCTPTSGNQTCTLTWQKVTQKVLNNYKVFYATTASGVAANTASVKYVQPPTVTNTLYSFSSIPSPDTNPTATVPADTTSDQINKFSGTGDFWILEEGKRLGFGTSSPQATFEAAFNIIMQNNADFTGATSPSGNSSLATKSYVDTQTTTYCEGYTLK